jgi:hypothetical protein
MKNLLVKDHPPPRATARAYTGRFFGKRAIGEKEGGKEEQDMLC